jgi:hypothetical protein
MSELNLWLKTYGALNANGGLKWPSALKNVARRGEIKYNRRFR